MKTQTVERPTQAATCANCPKFQDFSESNGRGWCATFDQVARSNHERTGACDQEIEALKKESQQQPPEPEQEQACNAGDKISHQLQPASEATTEFEQGRLHGRNDARAKWHPIYKEPATEYATGYLAGYDEVLNPRTQQSEPLQNLGTKQDSLVQHRSDYATNQPDKKAVLLCPEKTSPVKSAGWSATWDDLWQCYRVWAGDRYNRYVGSATTYQDAERLGQQDAALDKTIKRQNAAVMAAYASVGAN